MLWRTAGGRRRVPYKKAADVLKMLQKEAGTYKEATCAQMDC